MRERLESEMSPMVDVAFTGLHDELALWPDGWVVDVHGDEDGNNPHIWSEIRSLGVLELTAPLADGERRCTCGIFESVYYNERSPAAMRWYLDGLLRRDVQ